MPERLATLLTLFRLAQPDLYAYFEDEQLRFTDIATGWLSTMLSKEMWLGDVLRLWGEYLLLCTIILVADQQIPIWHPTTCSAYIVMYV